LSQGLLWRVPLLNFFRFKTWFLQNFYNEPLSREPAQLSILPGAPDSCQCKLDSWILRTFGKTFLTSCAFLSKCPPAVCEERPLLRKFARSQGCYFLFLPRSDFQKLCLLTSPSQRYSDSFLLLQARTSFLNSLLLPYKYFNWQLRLISPLCGELGKRQRISVLVNSSKFQALFLLLIWQMLSRTLLQAVLRLMKVPRHSSSTRGYLPLPSFRSSFKYNR